MNRYVHIHFCTARHRRDLRCRRCNGTAVIRCDVRACSPAGQLDQPTRRLAA